ncbi:NUDIX hydrolase [Halobacillus sp. K22]|uniref:NUDIX hydrolase n=1 Tax=Halobacillus sp. K22 TaxID=3457431 RepID=UPI003FCEA244
MDVKFQTGSKRFNYRAAGILIEQDHVLLHKQVDDTHWALPGGRVELGEQAGDTIVREMNEELGYEVDVASTPWIAENFFHYDGHDYHELGFYFYLISGRSHFQEGPFQGLEGERLIYQWIPITELNELIVQPEFLTAGLGRLPEHTEHVVIEN